MASNARSVASGNWLLSRRWLLVAPALLFLWIIAQIDKTNVSLIIADSTFLKELNLVGHNTELGGLMSSFFIGYGVSIFIWGFLVDRFGPRKCAIAGTLAWAVALFLSSRVGGIKEYLLIRFLLGAAEGNLWPVCNALTNRWFPVREHSRVQAFWITGSTLGTAIGVPIVTALMLASGWRGTLAALSLVSLLPIAVFYFVKDWPREQKGISPSELRYIESNQKVAGSVEPLSFQELLRSKPFWLITVCQFASATTIYTLVQWIPSYLTAFRHLSFKSMGGWITLGYVVATILTLAIGYIADRTMQRSLAGAWVSLAFVVIVLPAQIVSPIASAVTLSALIGVASSTAALNGALMQTLVRPEAIARGTGVYAGIGMFSSALGPALFGTLISYLGGQYWGGFLFLGILNAFGAASYFTLHRVSSRSRRPSVSSRENEQSYIGAR
ncbi:MAG: MFS transporter [Bryobacteraceae bacterium]|jgi:sugar phosphate permease